MRACIYQNCACLPKLHVNVCHTLGIMIIRALSPLPKCTWNQPKKRKAESCPILTVS